VRQNASSQGNVLFLILIAVALFAALSYAVTGSSRNSGGDTQSETVLIASTALTQYGSALENAMTFLTVSKSCSVDTISFERPPLDGSDTIYINTASPPDLSCHIFSGNGGRVSVQTPPTSANDGRDWAYIETRVLGVGADQTACGPECNELVAILGGIRESVCQKINERLTGVPTIPQQDDGNDYEDKIYTGSFTTGADIDGDAQGHHNLCIKDSNGVNYYYHVLLPR